jgi:hypothetical protein
MQALPARDRDPVIEERELEMPSSGSMAFQATGTNTVLKSSAARRGRTASACAIVPAEDGEGLAIHEQLDDSSCTAHSGTDSEAGAHAAQRSSIASMIPIIGAGFPGAPLHRVHHSGGDKKRTGSKRVAAVLQTVIR